MKKLITLLVVLLLAVAMCASVGLATVTQVDGLAGTYTHIANVTYGADTDIYQSVTHSLGGDATKYEYTLTPLDANCSAAINTGTIVNTAMPYVNDISSTTIGIGKYNLAGSATCSVRVMIRRIHSIIQ